MQARAGCRSAKWSVGPCWRCYPEGAGVAEPKPTSRRALQLEYRFDRLLPDKLAQVYQALVPDKRWSTGAVLEAAARPPLEVMNEQDSSNLRARLLRPAEGE